MLLSWDTLFLSLLSFHCFSSLGHSPAFQCQKPPEYHARCSPNISGSQRMAPGLGASTSLGNWLKIKCKWWWWWWCDDDANSLVPHQTESETLRVGYPLWIQQVLQVILMYDQVGEPLCHISFHSMIVERTRILKGKYYSCFANEEAEISKWKSNWPISPRW